MVRLLRAAGAALPAGRDRFDDDDNSAHEPASTRWRRRASCRARARPGLRPTRRSAAGEMATIVAGGLERASGGPLATDNDSDNFRDDDSSTHQQSINRPTDLAIISGTSVRDYQRARSLRRGQMASFLARSLAWLGWPTPASHPTRSTQLTAR